jgi:hypothetical protein
MYTAHGNRRAEIACQVFLEMMRFAAGASRAAARNFTDAAQDWGIFPRSDRPNQPSVIKYGDSNVARDLLSR